VAFLNVKQLPKERILLGRRIGTEAGLFALVARTIAERNPPLAPRVRDSLARRHARRPVSLGAGLALPHAAVRGLTSIHAVFVRSSTPIPMHSPDELGVTDVLALLVPSPGLGSDYDLLMALTALLTRSAVLASLRAARTAREVQAILTGGVRG
jgi:PTS system nitrogen regulatory IIA component